MRLPTRKLAALEGLISPEVGLRLAELAAEVPSDQAIVEVGSYKGKSAAYLGAGARSGKRAHVYAHDAWDLTGNTPGRFNFTNPDIREKFHAQIASVNLDSYVTGVRAFSADAAASWTGPPVGLVLIDASHLYEDVRADFHAWAPHLASPEATVIFDDYDTRRNPGVRRVVDQLLAQGHLAGLDLSVPPLAVARSIH